MRIQGKYIIVIVLMLFSLILAYDSVNNYMNPYLSVSEIKLNNHKYLGKGIQVMGIVATGSLNRGGSTINFNLTDGQRSIMVEYSGSLPQNFNEGKDVVAVGFLSMEERIEATRLLVKCPSKYEGEEAPKQNNHTFLTAIGLAATALIYISIVTLRKRY